MAATKFYLDKRKKTKDGTFALKININKDSSTSPIDTKVRLRLEQWDAKACKVINRPDKTYINSNINRLKQDIDDLLVSYLRSGQARDWSAVELKRNIEKEIFPESKQSTEDKLSLDYLFREFTNIHKGRTKEIYEATYIHLKKYLGKDIERLRLDKISRIWLEKFDEYLSKTSPSKNARNIHLRNLRAVFNYAIDNQVTNNYPFRKFSIKPIETVKRSLSVDELRRLFSYPCEDWQRKYVDIFKLIFILCGINIIDLYNLKQIVNGRVDYYRAKTKKLYSIKVEPEALEIINRHKGTEHLLDIADRCKDYRHYAMRLNAAIQRIEGFEEVTTYWMRHTWATIAAELDIPKETIAEGLGHEMGNQTTSIYIKFNQRKVDEANRKVIDYVLYNKI